MTPTVRLITDRDVDFDKYLAAPPEAAKVKPASHWCEAVIDAYYGETVSRGSYLPWLKTHDHVRLRPGEFSIWAGTNGHGKSMLLNLVVLSLLAQSETVCIASLEMKPVRTLERMARQFVGVQEPSPEYIRKFHAWAAKGLWLYDQIGTVKHDRMIALARYCIAELGINHFVIDSLMKCGIATDDYNLQKRFVDELSTLAKDTNTHIHLVAHSRKSDSENTLIDKFGVKGSGDITDMADNVFIIWRNKRKEIAESTEEISPDLEAMPDTLLLVDKQRNGEWVGKIALWNQRQAFQFLPAPSAMKFNDEHWMQCRFMS